ncbi:hypothetical protein V5740_05830 [Croceibacterium sp. TMG7-5b_MA50]|uniref:hypothetical protein n=1 Tax=Croceibacterium sp. TMG7-5b_MA50 TaxID=3121290 RepID=UPI0032213A2F
MKPGLLARLLAGGALALTSGWALATPESLLPPGFGQAAPTPSPSPAPTPRPAPSPRPSPAAPQPSASAVVQPLPVPRAPSPPVAIGIPTVTGARLPSVRELEAMSDAEFDALFGLQPQADIPPGARRALRRLGIIDQAEGGFGPGALAGQPAGLVRAALIGTRGPLVSRWGHILLRRVLASRMEAPAGMDPVAFAALRADLLNRLGEPAAARALVQDIESAAWSPGLGAVALSAYLGTGDILGICPVMGVQGTLREDTQWQLARTICEAHSGETREAERTLRRMLASGDADAIDVRLAQRYAGAAGNGRRSVTIEWDDVDAIDPWRLGLARALGLEVPDGLLADSSARLTYADALIPATPLARRVAAAGPASAAGVLSAGATVDLLSLAYDEPGLEGPARDRAQSLRLAYVARDPAARVAAMRDLWGGGDAYAGQVLTAYAAARLPVLADVEADAPQLIGSMLAAGLDRNAARWADVVPEGSLGWALLAVGTPGAGAVDEGALDDFIADDSSSEGRKGRFLVAGLAGLGRLDAGTAQDLLVDMDATLRLQSAWSRRIDAAAQYRNQALVALLAGVGMQGDGWDRMTARQLFHIVRALSQVGLEPEARMIAAEAVARA